MKRNLFLIAAASLAFVGCTNDEYVGVSPNGVQNGQGRAIMFSGVPGNISRAPHDGTVAAGKLNYQFNVFGLKKLADNSFVNVFAQNAYKAPEDLSADNTNDPYTVWYVEGSSSTSNTSGWEYVGLANTEYGTENYKVNLDAEQTIKYWDYKATEYQFVAYSVTKGGTFGSATLHESGYSFAGTPDNLSGFYVADKVTMAPPTADDKEVTFKFRAGATGVRLGIYETVPGYEVNAISFKVGTEEKENATLAGSFISTSTGSIKVDVTFDETSGESIVTSDLGTDDANKTTEFDFGTFTITDANPMGKTATAPTWAIEEQEGADGGDYTYVFPNTDNVGAMTLCVDFTLKNDVTGETIEIKNAKAVVPAEYMEWKHNHKYTYLFKISDNTEGDQKLYPITFDAVVVEDETEDLQGTTTTVAEPSITTYQKGDVVTNGITYLAGEAVEVMVMETDADGNAVSVDLTEANLKVYTGFTADTEDDLAVAGVLTATGVNQLTVTSVDNGNKVTFTPAAAGKYAIEYTKGTANYYKLLVVGTETPVE